MISGRSPKRRLATTASIGSPSAWRFRSRHRLRRLEVRRTTLTLVVLAVPVACAFAAASPASTQPPLLTAVPAVAVRGQNATVTVTRLDVPSLEVRVVGGTTNLGRPLPWTPLRNDGRGWHGLLPAPELRGFYPLELRVRRGSPVMRSEQWLLPGARPGHAVTTLVRHAGGRRSLVGANAAAPGAARRDETVAATGIRPARPPPAPAARRRVHPGRAPGCPGSAGDVRHSGPRRAPSGPWRLLEATVVP